jgi:hypothetical protein
VSRKTAGVIRNWIKENRTQGVAKLQSNVEVAENWFDRLTMVIV